MRGNTTEREWIWNVLSLWLHSTWHSGIPSQAVTPLCSALCSWPGVFGTVEMWPSHAGIWRVECKVGEHQQAGMSALFLVYDLSE